MRTQPNPPNRTGPHPALAALGAAFPEILLALTLFDAARSRVRGQAPDRGDAIQWVIVTAIGAAIAVTVGTIIYGKLKSKATNIDVTTPGPNS